MPRIYPKTVGALSTPESMQKDVGMAVDQIRSQTNTGSQLLTLGKNGSIPRGARKGDLTTAFHPRGIIATAIGDRGTSITTVIPRNAIDNIPTFTGTGVPTIDEFPEEGTYGWKIDPGTAGYWAINWEGTVYWATAIAGGITFGSISGTISNDQHGQLGRQTTAGNPHHTNATTTQPGFLSTAFFDLLNGATDANTASTIVMRSASREIKCVLLTATGATSITASGLIQGNDIFSTTDVEATQVLIGNTADVAVSYKVASTKVVGAQNTGWTAQTATPSKADLGATPTAAALAQWAAAVQNALASHGLFDN